MFKNILVATDGSSSATQAVKVAGNLSRNLGADLWIVTAFDPVPTYLAEPIFRNAVNAQMELAGEVLSEAVDIVGKIPGKLESEVLEGPAAAAILREAETRKNDLIVMGSRSLGPLSGILLGSQSLKVLHYAHCPVLIVP